MANKLIKCALGICKTDDRDSYINKRLDLTGRLLNNLFRNYFNKLVKDMQKQTIKEKEAKKVYFVSYGVDVVMKVV